MFAKTGTERPRHRSTMRLSLAAFALVGMLACVPPPRPGRMYVVRRPPPVRVERIGVAPGHGYVWIGGFWRWNRPNYVWISGRWMVPPAGYSIWVPGRWHRNRHGWYWVEGRWRR